MTLELRVQAPIEASFSKMLWTHPHLGVPGGQVEVAGLNDFLWVPYYRDCSECGQPTTWIDLAFEVPLHPGRCSEKVWDEYRWAEMRAQWELRKERWIEMAKGEARQVPED